MKLKLVILLLAINLSVFAQEQTTQEQKAKVIKYRATSTNYRDSTMAWGKWERSLALITFLDGGRRIKLTDNGTPIVFDITDYQENTETNEEEGIITYQEMFAEDPDGKDWLIVFKETKEQIYFAFHSGKGYVTTRLYAVDLL